MKRYIKKLNNKGFEYITLIALIVLLGVVIVTGVYVYHLTNKKTPSSTATTTTQTAAEIINEFNVAMQKGQASTVLALESPAFQKTTLSQSTAEHKTLSSVAVSDNYYTVCKSVGQLCLYDYSAKVLAASKITTSTYKAADGKTGVTETFTYKTTTSSTTTTSATTSTTASGTVSTGSTTSTESGSSTNTFSESAVPNGNSWLIDNIGGGSDSFSVTAN